MKAEMMSFGCIVAVCAMAIADEPTAQTHDSAVHDAGFVEAAHKWVSLSAFAEIQSAYLARGAVVDSNPFSAQFADAELLFGDFGHVGGHAWSVTSLSRTGQSAPKRCAYNEVDYNLHYVYDWNIADGWTLENRVARQWVTLPGYRGGGVHTICEWHAAQALHNPWVTPYWLLRHATRPGHWSYWDVGVKRSFGICDDLSFTVDIFGELGDAHHFAAQYGGRPGGEAYHSGLQALNLVLRLDYKITEYLGIYAFVWQFDLVSDAARDAVKASSAPEAKRDITVFGVGVSLNF